MSSNNKTKNTALIKNSLIMVFRMIISMGINFYTSRVILNNLGVTDYGVYTVVGGVITLFSFIQLALAASSSRFITVELSKENNSLHKVINATLTIHLIAGLIILLFAETVGLYVVNHILDIPLSIKDNANIVFQLTVANLLIILLTLPFEALLIAYEKINLYAYFNLADSSLRLIAAIIVGNIKDDKILYYALILLVFTLLTRAILVFISLKNLSKYKLKLIFEKKILYPIVSFFSWDLYGNLSISMRNQGILIIQNIFFGVIINASSSIANQIQGGLYSFSNNILFPIRPQIIKSYVEENYTRFNFLLNIGTIFSFIISLLIAIPLFLKLDFIVHLWLVNPPEQIVIFGKIVILINLTEIFIGTINTGIHASGKIKKISLISGSIYLLICPLTYLFYSLDFPSYMSYILILFVALIINFINIHILKNVIKEFDHKRYYQTFFRLLFIGILSFLMLFYIHKSYFHDSNLQTLITFTMVSSFLQFPLFYFIGLEQEHRLIISKFIDKKIRK